MKHISLWRKIYGDASSVYDYAGREIHLNQYGKDSKYAWNIEHIVPVSEGGTDAYINLTVTHIKTNSEREYRNTWNIDGYTYQVRKIKYKNRTYRAIFDITDKNNPKLETKSHTFEN
ncbi:HNH endonuclease domain-containing protein [Mycoplasma sp. 480]|uniref:HNH endonuclease domain-containing protein n=1 Tax=Mycoplasma sp. 480 TaxID=3440155 RepID=UPI003F5176D8